MLPGGNDYNDAVLVQTAAGETPDLFWANRTVYPQFVEAGVFSPLDDLLARDSNVNLDTFFPTSVAELVIDGTLYGMPIMYHSGVSGLFYHKPLFDEAGVAYPDESWRYQDEFLDAARKITRSDSNGIITAWGVQQTGYNPLTTIIYSFGGEILNESGSESLLTSEGTVEAIRFVRSLHREHRVARAPGDGPEPNFAFPTGKVGMQLNGSWGMTPVQASLADDEWSVAPVPMGPSGIRMPGEGAGAIWGIARHSQNPEAAWTWLAYLASDEVQHKVMEMRTNFSSKPNVAREYVADERLKAFVTALEEGHHRRSALPAGMSWGEHQQTVMRYVNNIFRGEAADRTALLQAKESIDAQLRAAR